MPNPDSNSNDDVGTHNYLNGTGCYIKNSAGKGRGVFATKSLPLGTVIEISPVLLFSKDEYETHARYTILDHYTFKWRDGRMALALGLGSLFNHSSSPNVSYLVDNDTNAIQYATSRVVLPDEELCIFYGHNLWFEPSSSSDQPSLVHGDFDDEWRGLGTIDVLEEDMQTEPLFLKGDPDEIIPVEQLPFSRLKITRDGDEEESMSSIRTICAWVVDITSPKHITIMLKWLKSNNLDSTDLGHLKRVRRKGDLQSLLLSTSATAPQLPEDLGLSEPYTLDVPLTAALTLSSQQLKNTLWPTTYAPRRKGEKEEWSRSRVKWAWNAMRFLTAEGSKLTCHGDLPVVAYVPTSFDDDQLPISFLAHDTRKSAQHPLRHAAMNVIRRIADYRASTENADQTDLDPSQPDIEGPRNGNHYLLTSLTLFITHEPCIMCSMALLHSRVKEIFYLIPMKKTGGCGGLACLPKLEGVNHRFGISQWDTEGAGSFDMQKLMLSETTDA